MPRKRAPKADGSESAGVRCRHCGSCWTEVLWTRHVMGTTIRMRVCNHCGGRTRSAEKALADPADNAHKRAGKPKS